jgi:hypothetical protein
VPERGTVPSAELAEETGPSYGRRLLVAEGAVIGNVARERDQALHRLQVVAAEIRAHGPLACEGAGSIQMGRDPWA